VLVNPNLKNQRNKAEMRDKNGQIAVSIPLGGIVICAKSRRRQELEFAKRYLIKLAIKNKNNLMQTNMSKIYESLNFKT